MHMKKATSKTIKNLCEVAQVQAVCLQIKSYRQIQSSTTLSVTQNVIYKSRLSSDNNELA